MKSKKSSISNAAPKPQRNGKIELLRFLFAIMVVCLHTITRTMAGNQAYAGELRPGGFSFVPGVHGAMAVEFFFLLSGFLMAKSVFKTIARNGNAISEKELAYETWIFEKKKYLSVFPYHVVAYALAAIGFVLSNDYGLLKAAVKLVKSVPNFLLTYMIGTATEKPVTVNPPMWYISVMIISMLFIYPFLRKYYRKVTHVVGPVIAVVIIGYLFFKTHSLIGVLKVLLFGYKGLFRGFAEILLGCTAFEISRWLEKKEIKPVGRVLLTVFEALAYITVLLYSCTTLNTNYEFVMLALLFMAIPVTFSNQTYLNKLFSNKFCYFLGKMSLFVYLVHMFPVYLAERYMADVHGIYKLPIVLVAAFVLAFAVEFGGNLLIKGANALKAKRMQKAN